MDESEIEADLSQFQFQGSFEEPFNLEPSPPNDQVTFFLGTFGQAHWPCKFYTRPQSKENLTQLRLTAKLSRKMDCMILLKPFIVEEMLERDLVVIGYEFDEGYQNWVKGEKSRVLFQGQNATLDKWWIVQIKNVLILILKMRREGVIHGHLNEMDSFVIVDDKLCVVNPTRSTTDASIKDLNDFKDFLRLHTKVGPAESHDWDAFLALFPDTWLTGVELDTWIVRLINHPVLKEAEERLEKFEIWWRYCHPSQSSIESALEKAPKSLIPWDEKVKDQRLQAKYGAAYKEVYDLENTLSLGVIQYNGRSLYDLGRYISKLIKRLRREGKSSAEIENGLREHFPGYLSCFYSSTPLENLEVSGMI